MQFEIKTKNGIVRRNLKLSKKENGRFQVIVDENFEIGEIWKADGRIKKFRNHRLDGTKTVDRWFAATKNGKELGEKFPYDEGFETRLEALTELLEEVLKKDETGDKIKCRITQETNRVRDVLGQQKNHRVHARRQFVGIAANCSNSDRK